MKTEDLKIGKLYELVMPVGHGYYWGYSNSFESDKMIKAGDIFLFIGEREASYFERDTEETFYAFLDKEGQELWFEENDFKFIREATK